MLTLVILHCCSLQTRSLQSLCNGSGVSALLEAPLELTLQRSVLYLNFRSFWGNKALIGCQSKLTFCFVSCPSSGGCDRIQQLLTHTPLLLYVGEPNIRVSAKGTEGKTVKITGERPAALLCCIRFFLSVVSLSVDCTN